MAKIKIKKEDYNRTADLEQKMKFFSRNHDEFGDIIVLKDPKTRQEIMMKEKEIDNLEEFALELNKTINRSNFTHPNLLKFIDYSTISKQDGGYYDSKIRLFYEHHDINLKRAITNRKKLGLDFTNEEITYLFYDLIEACAYLENKGVSHGDLSPDCILLSDEGKFILGDKLKYKAKFPQNLIDRYIRNRNMYISPEIFTGIKKRDSRELENLISYKNDVFILGMCFLSAGNLFPPTKIFQKQQKSVDRNLLEKYIQNFETRYSNNYLICKILRKMLCLEPINRPSFLDLKYSLPNKSDIEKYFFPLRLLKKKKRQITMNRTNPSLNTTQVSKGSNKINIIQQQDHKNFFDINIKGIPKPKKIHSNQSQQNINFLQQNVKNNQNQNIKKFLQNQNLLKTQNNPNLLKNHINSHNFHTNQAQKNHKTKQNRGLTRNQSFTLTKPNPKAYPKHRQTNLYTNYNTNRELLDHNHNNNPLKRNYSHKKTNSNFVYHNQTNLHPHNIHKNHHNERISNNSKNHHNERISNNTKNNLLKNYGNDYGRQKSNSFYNGGYNSNRVINNTNNKKNEFLNMKTHKKNNNPPVSGKNKVNKPPVNIRKKTYKKQKSNFQIFD